MSCYFYGSYRTLVNGICCKLQNIWNSSDYIVGHHSPYSFKALNIPQTNGILSPKTCCTIHGLIIQTLTIQGFIAQTCGSRPRGTFWMSRWSSMKTGLLLIITRVACTTTLPWLLLNGVYLHTTCEQCNICVYPSINNKVEN